jgi:hypothetical protein
MSVPEGRSPSRDRLAPLFFAVASLTICFALLATGGFQTTVFGVRVSARSPLVAGGIAAVLLVVWFLLARRRRAVAADLAHVSIWLDTHARTVVLFIAAGSGSVAVAFATFSAAGSDPSGYFSQAAMLARGALTEDEPLAALANWPDAPATLAPLGWVATGTTQVPTYAVGLPLLMAMAHNVGGTIAASLVVSLSAALAVWFAARLAMLLGGGAAGVLAAAGLATMPVFLYESIQPMPDVPVTAAWLAVWFYGSRRRAWLAGLALATAVLIRPNLAPLALVPVLAGLKPRPTVTATAGLKPIGHRPKPAVALIVGAAAASVVVAYLQWRYFGSPLRSGYGSASEIYSLANLAPNARLYLQWLLDTHGPWLLFAPLVLSVNRDARLRWMLIFATLLCVAYFVYSIFEHWSYLRFLLPAMAIAAIAVSVFVVTMTRKLAAAARAPVLIGITLLLAAWQASTARELGVFRLAGRQSRAVLAGRYLASALPPNAVVITGEQSGAVRYYSGRSIVRWDFLQPADLPLVTNELIAADYEVWIALDDWEVPLYREKFPRSIAAALDWPPAVEAGVEARTLAWRLRDRAEFMNGATIPIDRLR